MTLCLNQLYFFVKSQKCPVRIRCKFGENSTVAQFPDTLRFPAICAGTVAPVLVSLFLHLLPREYSPLFGVLLRAVLSHDCSGSFDRQM